MAADGVLERADAAAVVGTSATAADAIALTVHGDLAEVEAAWRAFETTAERTAFQSFDWLATWQREIGAARRVTPAIVVGREPLTGALLFILPLAVAGRRPARRLMFLASPLCDYNAPLLAPAFAASLTPAGFRRLWASVIRRLRSEARFRFDLYDLQKMPQTVAGRDHPFRALPLHVNPSRAYIATLGGDWEAFYAERRSASTRKTERKQAKRLAEQGDIAFIEPAAGDARVATVDTLIGQKRRALARMGADDIFDRQGYVAFYRAVAASEKMAGLVHVSRLDVGSEMGAASVALVDRGSYSLVLSSYNDGPISQHGPGRAHLHALMQRAIAQHFAAFDFTIGDEPYKRDWCDREVTLYDYHAAASLHAWPIALALSSFRGLKRMVKQNPALWEAYTRLRARLR